MKNINVIAKGVSSRLGTNEVLTRAVLNFYFTEAQDHLRTFKSGQVYIKNLGTFAISKYKLYKVIRQTIERIRFLSGKHNLTWKQETIDNSIAQSYALLSKLLVHRNEIATQEYERKKRKQESLSGADRHAQEGNEECGQGS